MELSNSKIAVTGATGFIGRYIVRTLVQRGAHVIGVVRNPSRVPGLTQMGVEIRKADLTDPKALALGFKGADAVISNAASVSLVGGPDRRAALIKANLQGAQNVFRAVSEADVGRVVKTSSAIVYRPKADHYYHEDDPIRAAEDPRLMFSSYAVSKACSEREAWRLAERDGIGLTSVRPHTVYGAFDESSFTPWFKRLLIPKWVSLYPSRTYLPLVYAGDVAEAICLALEKPVSIGRAYNIAGAPMEHSFWDLLDAWIEAGGPAPRKILPVPVPLVRRYDIRRAAEDLGWKNRPLVDGCRETLEIESSEAAPQT